MAASPREEGRKEGSRCEDAGRVEHHPRSGNAASGDRARLLYGYRYMRRFRSHVLGLLVLAAGPQLLAQAPPPASLEFRAGLGSSLGGAYHERAGLALDATVASRIRRTPGRSIVVAANWGVQGTPAAGNDCVTPNGSGNCLPASPLFVSFSALAGLEWARGHGVAARTLIGPAYYSNIRGPGGGALGVQGRMDLASPTQGRVALVASLQGAVLPSFRSDVHALGSIGLGLRIQ
jgi:hypothetical protein